VGILLLLLGQYDVSEDGVEVYVLEGVMADDVSEVGLVVGCQELQNPPQGHGQLVYLSILNQHHLENH
jgi:hypothetical protein